MSEQIEPSLYNLPKNWSTRPLTLEDVDVVVDLLNDVSRAKGIQQKHNADILRSDWQEPNFQLEASSIAVEDDTGTLLGYAILWDTSTTPVRPWSSWAIQHKLYDTPLVGFLLNWLESKAHRVLDKVPADARVVVQTNVYDSYEPRIQALLDAGFHQSRNFYRMLIKMDEAPPQAVLPEHIIIRSMQYPDELRAVVEAVEEGFRDHWGFVEEPIEESLKFWTHYTETDELFDPALYFLAIDTTTDTIVGAALCRIEQYGKPESAYIEDLAVLPSHRRQGIALAMLHHVFGKMYQRGRRQVALHVDAESLTGATRLYGKAGMDVVETWVNYEKVLRDGVELSTTSAS